MSSQMFCPACGTQKVRINEVIPESQIGYIGEDGIATTEFLPESQDCECMNCGARWLLFADAEDRFLAAMDDGDE